MKTTLKKKAEKGKHAIQATATKSKETIRQVIDSNATQLNAALSANKKIVDTVLNELNQLEDKSVTPEKLKAAMEKSLEFSEDALDNLINAYSSQMQVNMDSNTRLLEMLLDVNHEIPEALIDSILKSFEISRQLTINNTSDIVKLYGKHNDLALNFNRIFRDNISNQFEAVSKIQHKGSSEFAEWAADWWNQNVHPK
jgi:type III secretion system FlhB-like substrate exporter